MLGFLILILTLERSNSSPLNVILLSMFKPLKEGSLFETLPFDIASKYFTSLDYNYEKNSGNSDNLVAAW